MKNRAIGCLALLLALAAPARAVDHNNVDAHRPLLFDDAEPVAFREMAFESGLDLTWPRLRPLAATLESELLYGIATDTHVALGLGFSGGGGSSNAGGGIGNRLAGGGPGAAHVLHRQNRSGPSIITDVSFGGQRLFNREAFRTPATALRVDAYFPASGNSQGVGVRLRGIASKHVTQYGRMHLNLDVDVRAGAPSGERELRPGLILGFTHPIGYPRSFTRTGLAELAVQSSQFSDDGAVLTLGVGMRQQVGVRSVLDLGVEADVAGFDAAPPDRLRLIAGYSIGF
ncbi:MAG: hypothetical protein ACO1SX_05945 [Actinomycetota bacterium]